ncbi:MAG: DegT/DnrJ/EryC1/StrS family aminotransferase [Planctomycetes bacterium]|nr:DegT/DnrJ/EryC1/StrS family aminotransferase [Planctomycetota bacterium]
MPPETIRNIPIARPCLGDEEWQALREPIQSGWLTQGPQVAAFEKAFAARHGVPYALATTSCTTALHLALAGLGIGPGDEVIVPAFTWVATANVVLYCGATPVFVDVDPQTYNIDPAQVATAITPRTRAIIAVHLFGLCADMDALARVAGEIPIVEDAACAAGASYHGRSAGSLGRVGCFSFHPRKTITTGEGGMITTRDRDLAERCEQLRNHGASISEEQRHRGPQPWILPEFDLLGYNYRMTDLQGAVGLVQLGRLDVFLEQRQKLADCYRHELAGLAWLRLPAARQEERHGWQAFVCALDERTAPVSPVELMQSLGERGIATRPGTHAVHTLAYYRERYGFAADDFPAALRSARQTIALPLHNHMQDSDVAFIAHAIRSCEQSRCAA